MMKPFKQKIKKVDLDTYTRLLNQLNRHEGRCTDEDVDKELELKLCNIFFPNKTVREAEKSEDIEQDIDCWVDNIGVQVKCRKNNHLYLEDYKTRRTVEDIDWRGGWLDRSKADIFIFVYPVKDQQIGCRFYKGEDLKRLLRIYRANENKECISEDDLTFIRQWGGLNAYVYHPESFYPNGDGKGCYYETLLD